MLVPRKMTPAPIPAGEAARLRALRSYDVLDTAFERGFDDLAAIAARALDAPVALVSLVDGTRQWFKARVGTDVAETSRECSFCAHAILESQDCFVVEDAAADPRFSDNPLVTGEFGLRFYAGAPLVTPEGHALGTLCVVDRVPRTLSDRDAETLKGLARAVVTSLELRRAMRHMRELAVTDGLTGLPNRSGFVDALDRAVEHQRAQLGPMSLLYLDLDGFKRVNDQLGHAAGDDVLRQVAEALRDTLPEGATAARLGGDEFAAILPGHCPKRTSAAGEAARAAISARMAERGWCVTASVGACCFLSAPVDSAQAVAEVDGLMYRAKRGGKDRVTTASFAAPLAA